MIEIKNGYKKYKSKEVLNNINLKFEQGKIYGLVGSNGSGKTQLMKAICGYIVLDKGSVYQNGKKIREKLNFIEDAGIIIESPDFMEDFTLLENLTIIKNLSDKKKQVDLNYWLDFYELKAHKNKKYKSLSLGTKQKMLLIQAFMTNPKTLILDECFSGLDDKSATKTREYIKNYRAKDKIIILTSHIKTDIEELCDEVILMHEINNLA